MNIKSFFIYLNGSYQLACAVSFRPEYFLNSWVGACKFFPISNTSLRQLGWVRRLKDFSLIHSRKSFKVVTWIGEHDKLSMCNGKRRRQGEAARLGEPTPFSDGSNPAITSSRIPAQLGSTARYPRRSSIIDHHVAMFFLFKFASSFHVLASHRDRKIPQIPPVVSCFLSNHLSTQSTLHLRFFPEF